MPVTTRRHAITEHAGSHLEILLAADTFIPSGHMVAFDANNNAVLAADLAGLRIAGIADGTPGGPANDMDADNRGNPAGKAKVRVRQSIFGFRNSQAQQVRTNELGKLVFVEDSLTVARLTEHSVVAGVALGLAPGYVFVWIPSEPGGCMTGWQSLG